MNCIRKEEAVYKNLLKVFQEAQQRYNKPSEDQSSKSETKRKYAYLKLQFLTLRNIAGFESSKEELDARSKAFKSFDPNAKNSSDLEIMTKDQEPFGKIKESYGASSEEMMIHLILAEMKEMKSHFKHYEEGKDFSDVKIPSHSV